MILGANLMAIQIIAKYKEPTRGILQVPDPRLRGISKNVDSVNDSTYQVVKELITTLKMVDKPYKLWLGMAAPQIGYSIRIIARKEKYRKYTVMINPEVLELEWLLPSVASCYSLPGLYLGRRHFHIKVKYTNLKGKMYTRIYKGGKAAVLQQEIDHINGKLICD